MRGETGKRKGLESNLLRMHTLPGEPTRAILIAYNAFFNAASIVYVYNIIN